MGGGGAPGGWLGGGEGPAAAGASANWDASVLRLLRKILNPKITGTKDVLGIT